jgi:pilus assembly protein CpaF
MKALPSQTPQWIQAALFDPLVTDFCINGTHTAFVDRGRGLEPLERSPIEPFNETLLRDWVIELLGSIGKAWDAKNPFVDGALPSGHRLHILFPPLSPQGMLISFRRLPNANQTQNRRPLKMGSLRWKDSPLYSKVRDAVEKGDSVLISGATGSGKTTLASDLLEEVPSHERIIALEDTAELAPQHPHFLSLTSRPANADGYGEVTLRTLLKQTLRMRPDRIVLGECRGSEVLELLQALNTGHRGALGTLHANSPRDALRRIELLCLLASNGALPFSGIRELLCLGIQWIVQVRRSHSAQAALGPLRKIEELWKIEGREGDTILMRQVLG